MNKLTQKKTKPKCPAPMVAHRTSKQKGQTYLWYCLLPKAGLEERQWECSCQLSHRQCDPPLPPHTNTKSTADYSKYIQWSIKKNLSSTAVQGNQTRILGIWVTTFSFNFFYYIVFYKTRQKIRQHKIHARALFSTPFFCFTICFYFFPCHISLYPFLSSLLPSFP